LTTIENFGDEKRMRKRQWEGYWNLVILTPMKGILERYSFSKPSSLPHPSLRATGMNEKYHFAALTSSTSVTSTVPMWPMIHRLPLLRFFCKKNEVSTFKLPRPRVSVSEERTSTNPFPLTFILSYSNRSGDLFPHFPLSSYLPRMKTVIIIDDLTILKNTFWMNLLLSATWMASSGVPAQGSSTALKVKYIQSTLSSDTIVALETYSPNGSIS